jgi:hypothetical protein
MNRECPVELSNGVQYQFIERQDDPYLTVKQNEIGFSKKIHSIEMFDGLKHFEIKYVSGTGTWDFKLTQHSASKLLQWILNSKQEAIRNLLTQPVTSIHKPLNNPYFVTEQ